MFCIRNILCVVITLFHWFLVDANNEFQLRLVSPGGQPGEGRVEVFRRGENAGVWGNICDFDWDEKDALVACRELGFGNVGYPVNGRRTNILYGSGLDVDYFYSEFKCNGSEIALKDCPYETYTSRTEQKCSNEQAAGLMCFADFDIRLISQKSMTEGRLELFYKGDWTNVHTNDFDDNSANVACMQVQDGQDQRHTDGIIVDASWYGGDEGNCQFSNFNCQGNETHIKDCDHTRAETAERCVNLVAVRCDDPCKISPCQNGGICESTVGGSLICRCKPGYLGELCTVNTRGVIGPVVDISSITFETIVLGTTFGLVGVFLLFTLLTTIISRFAFDNALERIIYDADQELASKDPGDFDRVIDEEGVWGEGEYDENMQEGGIEGFGEGEEEYVGNQEDIYHEENEKNESLGAYDERFDGSYDVKNG